MEFQKTRDPANVEIDIERRFAEHAAAEYLQPDNDSAIDAESILETAKAGQTTRVGQQAVTICSVSAVPGSGHASLLEPSSSN